MSNPGMVRVHYPVTDGYSIRLYPKQSFKISIYDDEDICDESRIVVDSPYLVYSGNKTKCITPDQKSELFYEINQLYDLSAWADKSAVFLGNVFIKINAKTVITACVYLNSKDDQSNNVLTIINPRSNFVKVKPLDTIHVVLSHEYMQSASYSYMTDSCNCLFKLQPEKGLINASYFMGDIPKINLQHINDKFNKTKEKHYYFQVLWNTDSSKVSFDTYDGGILKFMGTGATSDSGKPVIEETSFLKMWVAVKEKNVSDNKSISIIHRSWDSDSNVLLNPSVKDKITLFEPNLSFLIEIFQPSEFYDELKDKNVNWRLETTKSAYNYNKGFIVSELEPINNELSDGSFAVIQRFRIHADCVGKTAFEVLHGTISLISGGGIVPAVERRISVNVAPAKYTNYNDVKKHTYYPNTAQEPQAFLSKVTIDKKTGSISDGLQSIKINRPIIIPVKKNLIETGFTIPTDISAEDDQCEYVLSSSLTRVFVRKGQKLIFKIESENYNESIKNIWSCIVMQNKTYLIVREVKIENINNNLVQTFELIMYPHYVPTTIKVNHYLCGLKFVRGQDAGALGKVKHVPVFLTHSSLYDKEIRYSRIYLASDFLERTNAEGGSKVNIILDRSGTDKIAKVQNWKHNSGLIFSPENYYDIFLSDKKIDWQIKIKQYPIPKIIYDKISDKIDRIFPWWPDELHPDSIHDTQYRISSIIDYQPKFYEIMEAYSHYFKNSTIPIAEIIFRSNILHQNREVFGTLIRTNQRYVKKLYLFGEDFKEDYVPNNADVDHGDYIELKPNALLDGQSIYVNKNKELRITTDTTKYSLSMLPIWMRLKKTCFRDYDNKTFIFCVEPNEIDIANEDDKAYMEGWIMLSSVTKNLRIRVILES